MTIRDAFDMYCREVIHLENQARKTEEHHQVTLNALLKFIGKDIALKDLTFDVVRKWRNDLEARGRSTGTIYGYVVRLRCVLAYAKKKKIECLDVDLVKPPKRARKRAPSFLTEEEIALLIETAESAQGSKMRALRNAAIVALLYSSGIRIGELVLLNIGDIHYDTFVVFGKGSKSRPCFIDPRARYYLDEYLKARSDNCEALFISDVNKERIQAGNVQFMFRNLRKKTGITKSITPHTTRHSFATNFLRNNGNIRYLQSMLGHESLETTQIYTHVVNEDLRAAHAKFHSISAPVQETKTTKSTWRPT